tara:strand:+ start:35 stop:544 length:510 start_codon:yes stop_codon:yes gene_type:complete
MNISQVKTASKVAEFISRNNNKNKISVNWFVDKTIQKDNRARVYLIVVDDEIYKIGGSISKGGIKNTLSSYTSSMGGTASQNRYCLQLLIREELDKNKSVEVYLIQVKEVKGIVSGLFEVHEQFISPFKPMEDRCLADYFKFHNTYPKWNFQERGEKLPHRKSKSSIVK